MDIDVFNQLENYVPVHRLSLLGFNGISNRMLGKLLIHYAKKLKDIIGDFTTDAEGCRKLLHYSRNFKKFKQLDIFKFSQNSSKVYIDGPNSNLLEHIEVKNFDVSTLVDFLENSQFLPTSLREYLKDKQCNNHSGSNKCKCCDVCKHVKCKETAPLENCKCVTNKSSCNRCCTECSENQKDCNIRSLVCCTECNYCVNCRRKLGLECPHEGVRSAIKVLVDIRNLCAHNESHAVYNDLDNGQFSCPNFPNCSTWTEVWKFATESLIKIATYLRNSDELSIEELEKIKSQLMNFGSMTKEEILETYFKIITGEYIKLFNKKISLILSIKYKVPIEVDESSLEIGGEISTVILQAFRKFILDNIGADIEVLFTESNPDIRFDKVEQYEVQTEIKITGQTVQATKDLTQYKDGYTKNSTELKTIMKNRVKEACLENNIPLKSIRVTKWKLNCLFITLALVKVGNASWTSTEKTSLVEIINNVIKILFNEDSIQVHVTLKTDDIDKANFKFTLISESREQLRSIDLDFLNGETTKIIEQVCLLSLASDVPLLSPEDSFQQVPLASPLKSLQQASEVSLESPEKSLQATSEVPLQSEEDLLQRKSEIPLKSPEGSLQQLSQLPLSSIKESLQTTSEVALQLQEVSLQQTSKVPEGSLGLPTKVQLKPLSEERLKPPEHLSVLTSRGMKRLEPICPTLQEFKKRKMASQSEDDLATNMMQDLGENVDQALFDEIFDQAQPTLLHFNITQEEIDKIRYHDIDTFPHKSFNYNLIIPIANFIGREMEIQKIHEMLIEIKYTKQKYAVIVNGLPAVGKSETIRKYCEVYGKGKYHNDIVWINAESNESIENCFNEVATILQVPTVGEKGEKIAMNLVIDSVYSMFAVQNANRHTLFVFDNINSMQEIERFLPSNQKTSHFIVATTQSLYWDDQRFATTYLDVFDQDISDQFLQNELDTPASMGDRLDLLSSLQYHPLALQQAVLCINIKEMSINEYLNIYNSNDWVILFGEEYNKFDGKSVYKSFSIALKRLEKEGEKLVELINMLAYLDGSEIKVELIMKMCDNDISEIDQKLNILKNYSLINRRKGFVTIHSIVQKTIKSNIEKKGETNNYIDILFHLVQDDFSDKKVMKDRGKLMFRHVLHLCDKKNIDERFIEQCLKDDCYKIFHSVFEMYNQQKTFIKLCTILIEHIGQRDIETMQVFHIKYFIVVCFMSLAQYDVAMEHLKEILQTLLNYPEENTTNFSLAAQHNIAMCLQFMGKYKEALELYKEVEKKKLQILGETHPGVLFTQHNNAMCLQDMRNYKEALELYKEVEKKKLQILGETHPSVLITQHNIAMCLQDMRNYKEALELYKEVEKKETQILGETHPSVLTTQHNIANCLQNMGKYKKALELYKVERKKTQILGETHPRVLTTQHNIANCLRSMGKYEEALKLYKDVEKKETQILGETHLSALTTQQNTASSLRSMGKYEEAVELYKEVERNESQILRETHPSVLITQHNTASSLRNIGKYEMALELYKEIERKQSQIIGETDPFDFVVPHYITFCLRNITKYEEALKLYKKIEQKKSHLSLLTTQNNVAVCLQNMGKFDEALGSYNKIKMKYSQILGEMHPSVFIAQHNVAMCLQDMGKYKEALELYKEVEKKETQILGEIHPSVLTTQHNIATSLRSMGKYEEALELYKDVERKETQILGETHPSVLTTQHNIASCLRSMGKYEEALSWNKKLESKHSQILGKTHCCDFLGLHNIASCFRSMGKYEEALEWDEEVNKKGLQIGRKINPDTLTKQSNNAKLLQKMGNYKEALELYKEVEKKETQILGETHPSVLTTQHNIANCLLKMARYDELLDLYKDVERKETHPSVLSTQHNIANCLHEMGKHEEALKLYKEVERKKLQIMNETELSVLITQTNIAGCLQSLRKYEEAMELHKEIERKKSQFMPETDPSFLTTQINIAGCLRDIGKYEEALNLYKEIERKKLQIMNETEPSVLTTRNNIATCLRKMGKFEEALNLYKEVDRKRSQILAEMHPLVLSTQSNIAGCLQDMGKYMEALDLYKDIESKQSKTLGDTHPTLLTTQHNISMCLQNMEK